MSLSGLHLPPGPITLEVSGDPSATATYLLRIDATTAPAADFESEPNDDPQTATAITGLSIRGQFAADDRDTFKVTTTGVPQLWQVDVTGHGHHGPALGVPRHHGARATGMSRPIARAPT